jgi:hypothetical protein
LIYLFASQSIDQSWVHINVLDILRLLEKCVRVGQANSLA